MNGTTGFSINGVAAGDQSGFSTSGAGDVNKDGIDDFLIGAPQASPGVERRQERVILFLANRR